MDSDTGAPGRTLAERLVDADKNLNNPCREWGYEDALGTSRLLREAAAALSSPPRADVEALLREAYFEGFYDANGRGDEGVESWRASRVFAALASPAPSAAEPEPDVDHARFILDAADDAIDTAEGDGDPFGTLRVVRKLIEGAQAVLEGKECPSLIPERAAPRADVEALAKVLLDKLELTFKHPSYLAAFATFQTHGGRYTGPTVYEEVQALREALASPAPSAAPVAAEGPTLEAFTKEFLRLTEGRMLAMPGLDHIPGLRQYAQAALRPQEPAPVVAQEPVRGACDALHCAISLAVAAGREDTAEVLRALYAGAAPPTEQPRNELEAYVNDLEAAAHTKEVGS